VTGDLDLAGAHVLILGWAGSTPKQLRGVGRFYRRHGAAIVVHSAEVFRAMGLPDGWAREGRAVAAKLEEADPDRLVVHGFSNGGFWTFVALLEALPAHLRQRIRAVVLDSAPGVPESIEPFYYAHYSTKAMVPVLLAALGRPPAPSHPVATPAVWAFMRLWYHLSPQQIAYAERSTQVAIDHGDWDHLILYSSADELVPPHFVEAFAHRLRAAGRGVETKRWEDSAHVRHMVAHRQEYFERIAAFLRPRVA
jgi:acetyl esterase/lipase